MVSLLATPVRLESPVPIDPLLCPHRKSGQSLEDRPIKAPRYTCFCDSMISYLSTLRLIAKRCHISIISNLVFRCVSGMPCHRAYAFRKLNIPGHPRFTEIKSYMICLHLFTLANICQRVYIWDLIPCLELSKSQLHFLTNPGGDIDTLHL